MNVRNFCFFCLFVFLLACERNLQSDSSSVDGGTDAGVTVDAPLVHDGGVTDGEGETVVDAGFAPGFRLGNAASDTFFQGSWRAPIKSSHTDAAGWTSCNVEANGWNRNDVDKMVEHFEATNQNLFIQHIQWPKGGSANCDWSNFLALADAAGTDLNLFVGYNSNDDLENYYDGVLNLRSHALNSGAPDRIQGWMVDDFHSSLFNVAHAEQGDYFSKDDLASLYDASHNTGADFTGPEMKFIPYVAEKTIPDHFMPSVILGVRGCWGADCTAAAHKLYPGSPPDENGAGELLPDLVQMEVAFNPGDVNPGEDFVLRFFLYDRLSKTIADQAPKDLLLVVSLNGVDVHRQSLLDVQIGGYADYIKAVNVELRGLNSRSDNFLKFRVEAEGGAIQHTAHKIAYLWDPRITRTEGSMILLRTGEMTFTTFRDPNRSGSTSTEHFIASTNDAWRLDDYVDGLFIKGTGISEQFMPNIHKQVFRSICRHLHAKDKLCMEAYWGNEQWKGFLGFNMMDAVIRFEHAQQYGDGLMVWRLENALGHPGGGVFMERPPLDTTNYDVMAVHPGNTSAMPGWYQNWTVTAPLAGTYTLKWWDNGGTTPLSADPERMNKELFVDGAPVLAWDAPEITHQTTEANAEETGSVEVWVEKDQTITVGIGLYNSFSDADFAAQFRLLDPDGNVLDLATGDFAAGTNDWATQAMYDCTVAYYTSHDYRDVCLAEIVDPDSLLSETSDGGI